ncbi:MAG: LPXTG cell wall anchor domain-containing protein [Actinobacteria bacterium]|nr:LPXTG cell wall anchor domain-containing protein [Actinomycetota bacterium]
MRSAPRLLALLLLATAAVLSAPPASAQQSSPCPPGQPSGRPPGHPPDRPGQPTGRPPQYPPGECNLRLSRGAAARGDAVVAAGSGYRPGSRVEVTLNSDPISLGSATTDGAGAFEHRFTVPASASLGSHTVTASGVDSNGAARVLSAGLEVTAASGAAAAPAGARDSSTLPRTGLATAGMAAVGAGLVALGTFAVMGARRRRPGLQ